MKHLKKFNELFDTEDLRNNSEMTPDDEIRDRSVRGDMNVINKKDSFKKWIINEYPLFANSHYMNMRGIEIFMFKNSDYFVSVSFESKSNESKEVTLSYKNGITGDNDRTETMCNNLQEISKYIDEKILPLLKEYNFNITKNTNLN